MDKSHTTIEQLIPIARRISPGRFQDILENFDNGKVDSIVVIRYKGRYLMGDGHHTASVLCKKGHEEYPIEILESDEDIAGCKRGAFRNVKTIDEYVQLYENEWQPMCMEAGVRSIRDYCK